jgi:hypothetical protein
MAVPTAFRYWKVQVEQDNDTESPLDDHNSGLNFASLDDRMHGDISPIQRAHSAFMEPALLFAKGKARIVKGEQIDPEDGDDAQALYEATPSQWFDFMTTYYPNVLKTLFPVLLPFNDSRREGITFGNVGDDIDEDTTGIAYISVWDVYDQYPYTAFGEDGVLKKGVLKSLTDRAESFKHDYAAWADGNVAFITLTEVVSNNADATGRVYDPDFDDEDAEVDEDAEEEPNAPCLSQDLADYTDADGDSGDDAIGGVYPSESWGGYATAGEYLVIPNDGIAIVGGDYDHTAAATTMREFLESAYIGDSCVIAVECRVVGLNLELPLEPTWKP